MLVALLVVAIVHGVRQDRRRVEALRAWAHVHHWQIIESPKPSGRPACPAATAGA